MNKAFLTFIAVIFIAVGGFTQITTTPEFPTDADEVTLVFNASGTPLQDFQGRVFAHTGVGIVDGDNWQYVIGEWGDNSNQPELSNLGNNNWELLITPDIRSYYGVAAGEEVRNMAFVFRSADGSKQSSDLFVDVFSSELGIIVSSPTQEEILAVENSIINVVATSPLADSMFVYVAGEMVYSTDEIIIDYDLVAENINGYWQEVMVEITATNNDNSVSESFVYSVIPQPAEEELPEGMVDGINYVDNTTVVLSLYAPEKDYVFVIGGFNNWQMESDFYMNKTPDGERFWLEITNLTAGQEYIFQYLVDGRIRIGDPFAEKVSDPWNDHYISEATYPGMLAYPSGMTDGIATVLQTAQEEYQWQVEDFEAPDVEDMVVYELLIRDFTALHTFQSLIDTIDYFKRLGVNVIELMPVNEFEGNISWGYNPNYYFAVDKYYGPKNTLKTFIDACHANGIAVVVDMVLNHSFGTSPMVMLYWDANTNRPAANNPWFNQEPTHDFNVGYDFNHESPQTRDFVKRVNNFWLDEYKVDGFRFDLSKGFTQKYSVGNIGLWGQYDQSRIDIWNDYSSAIWQTKPEAWVILEHFADNDEETVLANSGMMPWGNANYNYAEASMGWTEGTGSDFSWISYKKRGWNEPHLVGYMESHDEERLQFKNSEYGNELGEYSIKNLSTGLERLGLAATFFFPIPGPKMIWQFGEMGYDYSIDYNGRTGPKPIKWDYLDDWRREYLFNVYAALINLKTEYDAFGTDDFTLDVGGADKSIVLRHSEMNVVIVGNFGMTTMNVTPNWPNVGTWYEFFTQSEYDVNSTNQSVSLEHGEYRLYTTQYIEKPEWLNTAVEEISGNGSSGRVSVYPNPARNYLNFELEMDTPGDIDIEVFDVMGKRTALIQQSNLSVGSHQISWELAGGMDCGIYFAIIRTATFIENIKFVVE